MYSKEIFSASPRNKTERLASSQVVALRSIQKAIKKQDLSVILGSLNNYNGSPQQQKESFQLFQMEEREVHSKLGELRREYDAYHTQSLRTDKEIQQFKDLIQQLSLEEAELITNATELNKELESSKCDYILSKQRFEDSQMNEKSYNHVISRLKHDILCFKKKLNEMAEMFHRIKAEASQADAKQWESIQLNQMTRKLCDEMMNNIEIEKNNRKRQIAQYNQQIKVQLAAKEKRNERMMKQKEIAEHASNDKGANEKKWRKLLLTHKVVHSLLKNKMEKEMKKFLIVEGAFQEIKTATGIQEAQEIVQKFLTKESTYGSLLGTIAGSEQKIDKLKQTNEDLKTKLQQLKDEVQDMEMNAKPSKKGVDSEFYKQFYSVDEKAKKAEIMKQKLYTWSIKMLSKLEKSKLSYEDDRINLHTIYPRGKDVELFQHLQKIITEDIDSTQPEEILQILGEVNRSQIRNDTLNEEYLKKNVRVKYKKPTQRENLKKTKSMDSKADLSNRSYSQFGQSSESSPEQSFYESESDGNTIDENSEKNHFNQLIDEAKQIKKPKKKDEGSFGKM
ncbi:unnamed protein product (macronuclear) [Paramecium tetraurelia]|uniref:Dynein regulatory complex protein 1/2 N-terminal domain-containing protein n=1 Tax=Paramecium tetraurelia TaxID=5888 RepID=A0CXX0_PARTE|nr:uncharacterized protein GSPATT00011269001 [Paramecium tetraurelia]CAK75637.1 unnamed protein product [Paramecium tetraurelia]|eukprot:XP_001443034.1 hypothetical protein (macronuclear) [Paramecium tetraurelia strain d4-2]